MRYVTTAHPWCGGHLTNINACGVLGVRVRVQVSKKELHTHIHLDYAKLYLVKKKRKKKVMRYVATLYLHKFSSHKALRS